MPDNTLIGKGIVNLQDLENISDAIRSKNGESGKYLVNEMATKINAISTGSGVGAIDYTSLTAGLVYCGDAGTVSGDVLDSKVGTVSGGTLNL